MDHEIIAPAAEIDRLGGSGVNLRSGLSIFILELIVELPQIQIHPCWQVDHISRDCAGIMEMSAFWMAFIKFF